MVQSAKARKADKYDVWVALYRAVRAVTERVDKELSESGHIPLADFEVLHRLYNSERLYHSEGSKLRLVDLARVLLVTPSSATRIMDRLERQGLAIRQPSTTDRRETLAVLTDEGKRVFESVRPFLLAAVERNFSSLVPDGATKEFHRILRSLANGISEPLSTSPAGDREVIQV